MGAHDSRLGEFIRAVCKQARLDAGVSPGRVAVFHSPEVKQGQTITDWEEGEIGWPRDPDDRVRAYSEVTGIPALDLWTMAIQDWRKAQANGEDDKGSTAT